MSPTQACADSSAGGVVLATVLVVGFIILAGVAFFPFWSALLTPGGRAEIRYHRSVGRRAAELMALGVEPENAIRRAQSVMAAEARETLDEMEKLS